MLTTNLNENIKLIKKLLPIKESFDLVDRRIKVGSLEGYLVFVDGFCKDEVMYYILNHLQSLDYDVNSYEAINNELAYVEVDTFHDEAKLKKAVLSGNVALVIDGSACGILLDVREYPTRGIGESEIEKITRGSKDSFCETIIHNTALIRRRLRDENLVFEIHEVTKRAKTDIVLGYLDDKVDKVLLNKIKDKLRDINLDSLVMNEKTLEEIIFEKKWYNIFPQAKYTQRPDISASQILEGNIILMVDTSPTVMILPATLFSFTQYIEDYFENSLVGTYTRLLRVSALITALFLTPVWLFFAENPDKIVSFLEFALPEKAPEIPYLLQFVLITLSFDILTMATLHVGSSMGGTFGFIGGLLIGELGISLGYFAEETVFLSVISLICGHCVPNKELESSVKFCKWMMLISVGLFGLYGLIGALALITLLALNTNTLVKEKPYLWPILPFDFKAFKNSFIRTSYSDLNKKLGDAKNSN